MHALCVFCASSSGRDPVYAAAARELGATLAARNIRLVYGGGSVGLMGELADAVLANGGSVTGVVPYALWGREVGHRGLDDLRIVDTMHERKAVMAELSDAFIALPGGLGTLEEIFEIWTWGQLGLHAKPCGFLNVNGYYTALFTFLDRAVGDALLRPQHRAMAIVETSIATMLEKLESWQPPCVEKWIRHEEV